MVYSGTEFVTVRPHFTRPPGPVPDRPEEYFICGSLVCGGLFERFNFELEMAVSGSMVALFVMLLPWMGIGWFLALTALREASMGIFDTGNNIR